LDCNLTANCWLFYGYEYQQILSSHLLINYREQHSAENAIILHVQEINFMRDKLVARSSSAHVNIAKYQQEGMKYQQEGIAKTKSMQYFKL